MSSIIDETIPKSAVIIKKKQNVHWKKYIWGEIQKQQATVLILC